MGRTWASTRWSRSHRKAARQTAPAASVAYPWPHIGLGTQYPISACWSVQLKWKSATAATSFPVSRSKPMRLRSSPDRRVALALRTSLSPP